MAISQFYKDNSIEYNKVIGNTKISFKATNENIMSLFDNTDFDTTVAISSNTHEFFHAFQTDNEFRVNVNFSSGIHFIDNSNYKMNSPTSNKICLLYSENNMDNIYSREEQNFYLYSNKTKTQNYSNLNIFDGFKVVTDFDFSRLVIVTNLSDSKFSRETIIYNVIDNLQDNNFNNMYIQLYYRNDDYTLTNISGYFALAEIVSLKDDIVINMLSFRNVLGEQMWSGGGITTADNFTQNCAMINNNVFIHTPTSNLFVSADGVDRYVPDNEKLGLWTPQRYSGGYQVFYDVVVDLRQSSDITACFGLRFITCSPNLITDKSSYDEHVKLAYMDEYGYVDYTNILSGADAIENSDTYNKTIDLNTSPDIPDQPSPYPSDGDKIEPMHNRSFAELTGFVKYYRLSREKIDDFVNACQECGNVKTGFEYLPYITSVMQYPFDVSAYVSSDQHSSTIKINGVTLDGSYLEPTGISATGHKLTSTQLPRTNIATTTIERRYNNFLDFAPYTTLELFIPLCGWVTLPTHCMGKTISVIMVFDIINGTCKGQVYCDQVIVAEKGGVCGRTIQLSGIETGLKKSAVISSLANTTASGLGIVSGVVSNNPVAVGYSAVSAVSALSQTMSTMNNSYTRTSGNMGDNTNFYDSSCCYLKITQPIVKIPENYNHSVGHICNETHTINECNGFTVCNNVDTSGLTCTQTEKDMIKAIMENGFYK